MGRDGRFEPVDLTGRTIMVTGANAGIGLATTLELARMGARVWMVCRDDGRCQESRDWVAEQVEGAELVMAHADFADLSTVRALADRFLSSGEPLHVLVNNAGGIFGKREITVDGHEMTWQVDLVASALLTRLLEPRLSESAPARVVSVTSDAYKSAKRVRFDDLSWEKRFRGFPAYAHAKLGLELWNRELARRLEGSGVTANVVHPGAVGTGFGKGWGGLFGGVWKAMSPFLRSSGRGAESVVWASSAPELATETGRHYLDRRDRKVTAAARDDDAATRLWNWLDEALG